MTRKLANAVPLVPESSDADSLDARMSFMLSDSRLLVEKWKELPT